MRLEIETEDQGFFAQVRISRNVNHKRKDDSARSISGDNIEDVRSNWQEARTMMVTHTRDECRLHCQDDIDDSPVCQPFYLWVDWLEDLPDEDAEAIQALIIHLYDEYIMECRPAHECVVEIDVPYA